jgi:hypothetical protein
MQGIRFGRERPLSGGGALILWDLEYRTALWDLSSLFGRVSRQKNWPFPTLRADKGSENRFIFFSGVVVPDDATFISTPPRSPRKDKAVTKR